MWGFCFVGFFVLFFVGFFSFLICGVFSSEAVYLDLPHKRRTFLIRQLQGVQIDVPFCKIKDKGLVNNGKQFISH